MDAVLAELLGDLPPAQFVELYLHRVPLSRPERAGPYARLATWERVEAILARPGVDFMVAKDGRLWEGGTSPGFAKVRELHADGYTLVIRHAEEHDPGIGALAEGFRRDLAAPVNVHVYCTPANRRGFGWHYDAEDVFILLACGAKTFHLRKNSVQPWPLEETLPRDPHFEREVTPLMKCDLAAGDWLYIPPGYWHVAQTGAEESISLAVGLMSPAAIDVYDFLRKELVASPAWRFRLPTLGRASGWSPDEAERRYAALLADLGRDLARFFSDPSLLRAYLRTRGWKLEE